MNQHKRQQIFARLRQDNPSPKTELNYQSNYELLIGVMLSAQATDVSVNKATHTLFKIADTPEAMISLGVDGLKSHIKSIGLHNTKARNIIKVMLAKLARLGSNLFLELGTPAKRDDH